MRTTLNLNDGLMRLAKIQAAKLGVTLTEVVESALRDKLMPSGKPGPKQKRRLPISSAKGGLRSEFKGMLPSHILAEIEDQDVRL